MGLSTLLVLATLILVNAFYVAAEFAIVSVRRSRIQQEFDKGNIFARRLLPVLNDPLRLDRYVAACQIGITLSSLILGAYGQATLAEQISPFFASFAGLQEIAAHSTAVVVVLVVLTVLQLIIGELVPKSLALEYPTQLSLLTIIPLEWSVRLYSGFIWFLNGSSNQVLRWLKFDSIRHQHIHSAEEIGLLIAESRDGGLLEPVEHRRLSRALELGVQSVAEIMVPRERVQALECDASLEEVTRALSEKPFTRLPVYEKTLDQIIGVVHARDVALAVIDTGKVFALRDIMRPLLVVSASMTAEQLLVKMREEKRQIAVVKDSADRTVGLVGIADVLDEFIGDVVERGEGAGPRPERLADGRIRLPASLNVAEAALWTGMQWKGFSQTVGGRIIEELGYMPAPGERVYIEQMEVEIEKSSRRRIDSVLARIPKEATQG